VGHPFEIGERAGRAGWRDCTVEILSDNAYRSSFDDRAPARRACVECSSMIRASQLTPNVRHGRRRSVLAQRPPDHRLLDIQMPDSRRLSRRRGRRTARRGRRPIVLVTSTTSKPCEPSRSRFRIPPQAVRRRSRRGPTVDRRGPVSIGSEAAAQQEAPCTGSATSPWISRNAPGLYRAMARRCGQGVRLLAALLQRGRQGGEPLELAAGGVGLTTADVMKRTGDRDTHVRDVSASSNTTRASAAHRHGGDLGTRIER